MNNVLLISHASKEPDLVYTPAGIAVVRFTLAAHRRWTDKASGERREETTWFSILGFEQLAETCAQFVHKGSKVFVEGRFATRTSTDRSQIERRVFEVVLTGLELLDPRPTGQADPHAPSPAEDDAENFPF
jgi:single-strand DNA-binding protein